MKIVGGLGNPGRRCQGPRHNVGFAVVDALAEGPKVSALQCRFQAGVAEWTEAGEKVLLVKPETFMNLSGRCVRQAVDFYQVPLPEVLVICDDINLPLGRLRFRPRGTHGRPKRPRYIHSHLGTTGYSPLRLLRRAAPDRRGGYGLG